MWFTPEMPGPQETRVKKGTKVPQIHIVWIRSPLFSLTIFWVLGLYMVISPWDFDVYGLSLLMSVCIAGFFIRPEAGRILLVYVAVFLLGILTSAVLAENTPSENLAPYKKVRVYSALVQAGPFFDGETAYLDLKLVGTSTRFDGVMTEASGEYVQLRVHHKSRNPGYEATCGQPGDIIRVFGALKPRKTRKAYAPKTENWNSQSRRIQYFSELKRSDLCTTTFGQADRSWWNSIQKFRSSLSSDLFRICEGESCPLLLALLVGEKRLMPFAMKELLQKAGLSHLIAVSGLHFGITIGAVQWLLVLLLRLVSIRFRSVRVHRWTSLSCIPFLLIYVVLTGGNPSCVRAACMFLVFLFAKALSRTTQLLPMFAVSLIGILAYDLRGLFDLSAGLSFAAVFGIYNYLQRENAMGTQMQIGTIRKALRNLGGVTVAATVFTLPLVLYSFHWFSIGGLALNVIATPLMSLVILPSLLVGIATDVLSGPISQCCLTVAESGVACMLWLSRSFMKLDWMGFYVTPPRVSTMLMWWLVLTGIYHIRDPIRYLRRFYKSVVFVGFVLAIWMVNSGDETRELRIHFLPVGQGDSVFIEFPSGESMLIDTGPSFANYSAAKSVIGPYIRRRGYTRIDAFVVTHSDNDHAGGVQNILDEFDVGRVFWNTKKQPSSSLRVSSITSKDKLSFGRAKFQVLHPACFDECLKGLSENNKSTVIRLDYGKTSFLFTGDIEAEVERTLIEHSSHLLDVDVLKVPHHGSKSSSTKDFLEAVTPDVSVVLVGESNRFNHPHREVLRRLQNETDRAVLRTDLNGLIQIVSNGQEYHVVAEFP